MLTLKEYFEYPALLKYIAKAGITTQKQITNAVQQMNAKGANTNSITYLMHIIDKIRCGMDNPIGAAKKSVIRGWKPTDKAIEKLKILTYGEPKRHKKGEKWQKETKLGDVLGGMRKWA